MRSSLSLKYICGQGIEIGACQNPLPLFNGALAKYVDLWPAAKIKSHIPGLAAQYEIKDADIIGNGEQLDKLVVKGSLDFVVANHFIEHCIDPIQTMKAFWRCLKPGGVLFMAVPDKRYTFDVVRELTSIEHFMFGFHDDHKEDWVRYFGNLPPGYEHLIHKHVWDFDHWLVFSKQFLDGFFTLTEMQPNGIEFICVYRAKPLGWFNAKFITCCG